MEVKVIKAFFLNKEKAKRANDKHIYEKRNDCFSDKVKRAVFLQQERDLYKHIYISLSIIRIVAKLKGLLATQNNYDEANLVGAR